MASGLPLLLFLGAGASRPFDIPTMSEMVERFAVSLGSKPDNIDSETHNTMRDMYSTIKNEQKKVYGYSDLESVFSVVEAIAENNPYKDLGHTQTYFFQRLGIDPNSRLANEQDQEAAKALVKTLQSFVRSQCTVTFEKEQKADQVYRHLFNNFRGILTSNDHTIVGDKRYEYGDWRIYTTNYDTIIESYWRDVVELNDTFQTVRGIPRMNKERATDSSLKLIKLHGSIDWYRLANKDIVKSESGRDRVGKVPVERELMLYPIQQKDLYLDPWIHLFAALKRDLELCNLWIVIGYAFNDRFVRNMFLEALEKRHRRLILVDPKSDSIVKEKFNGAKAEILQIPRLFGDDGTVTDIVNAIKLK